MAHHDTDTITEAFTNSDCWHLANHIVNHYEGFEIAYLHAVPLGDNAWFHAVAHRIGTDTYVDINGEHTGADLTCDWDWMYESEYEDNHDSPEWDQSAEEGIGISTRTRSPLSESERTTTVNYEDAIALIIERGVNLTSRN